MTVTWEGVNRAVQRAKLEEGEWAGVPLPLPGIRLVVEPRHPYAHLTGVDLDNVDRKPEERDEIVIRNSWWCYQRRLYVYVIQEKPGAPSRACLVPALHPLTRTLQTFIVVDAWSLEAEAAAVNKLADLIGERRCKQYLLTGGFIETSPRSRVTYFFRRLRPTVAMRPDSSDGLMRAIAALCLHPVAYYDETWAGSMVPTDDVLAHLLLMRGDEPRFWRQANQHPVWAPEAGIAI